jgi:hypothetical protein
MRTVNGWARRAVVAYSFVCGMLCGNGNTLVLKRDGVAEPLSRL